MAQHDQVIENGPGLAVRSDINNALAALFSSSSGPIEPVVKVPGQVWFDTGDPTTTHLKIRDRTNSSWIELAVLGPGTPLQALLDQKQTLAPVLTDLTAMGPALTAGAILVANGANDLGALGKGANNTILTIDGSGNLVWSASGAAAGGVEIYKLMTASGAYARTTGFAHGHIILCGVGGGGGNTVATAASQWSQASGGSQGAFVELVNCGLPDAATVTIPAATNGAAGSLTFVATSGNSLSVTVPGGYKGLSGVVRGSTADEAVQGGAGADPPTITGLPSGTLVVSSAGQPGGSAVMTNGSRAYSSGAPGPYGGGGLATANGPGGDATGPGAGGGGATNGPSTAIQQGGIGGAGFVLIIERQ